MAAREKLGDILISAGLLDQASLDRALGEQQRWGGQLGRYLVEMGMITEEILVRALSTQYKLPAVALDPPRLNIPVGRLIPKEICERNGLICFRADLQKKFLDVAVSDPSNVDGLEEVRVATRYNVRPHIAAPSAIDQAINLVFYGDIGADRSLSLAPDSPLRDEPRTSELIRGARPPSSPHQAAPPRRNPVPPRPAARPPALDLHISEIPLPPPAVAAALEVAGAGEVGAARQTNPSLRPVDQVDEAGFHITLDVPAVDREAKAQTKLEERVAYLEAVHARDAAILEGLLEALVNRGLLTREEVLRLIIAKK